MKIEELQKNYQRERQRLEEQEDDLHRWKKQGFELIEQAEQRLRHGLDQFALDQEPLKRARRSYSGLQEHYQQALQAEQRKLHREQDELEHAYRQGIRKITTEKNGYE